VAPGTAYAAARRAVADVPPAGIDHLVALVGLADEPELQRQAPLALDLSGDGSCVVLGGFGAGKTTLLRQVGLDVACR